MKFIKHHKHTRILKFQIHKIIVISLGYFDILNKLHIVFFNSIIFQCMSLSGFDIT